MNRKEEGLYFPVIEHHKRRYAAIAEACRNTPRSVAEIVPVIFHLPLDPHQMSFAFSEALAHVNFMLRQGDLAWAEPRNGVQRMIAA